MIGFRWAIVLYQAIRSGTVTVIPRWNALNAPESSITLGVGAQAGTAARTLFGSPPDVSAKA